MFFTIFFALIGLILPSNVSGLKIASGSNATGPSSTHNLKVIDLYSEFNFDATSAHTLTTPNNQNYLGSGTIDAAHCVPSYGDSNQLICGEGLPCSLKFNTTCWASPLDSDFTVASTFDWIALQVYNEVDDIVVHSNHSVISGDNVSIPFNSYLNRNLNTTVDLSNYTDFNRSGEPIEFFIIKEDDNYYSLDRNTMQACYCRSTNISFFQFRVECRAGTYDNHWVANSFAWIAVQRKYNSKTSVKIFRNQTGRFGTNLPVSRDSVGNNYPALRFDLSTIPGFHNHSRPHVLVSQSIYDGVSTLGDSKFDKAQCRYDIVNNLIVDVSCRIRVYNVNPTSGPVNVTSRFDVFIIQPAPPQTQPPTQNPTPPTVKTTSGTVLAKPLWGVFLVALTTLVRNS